MANLKKHFVFKVGSGTPTTTTTTAAAAAALTSPAPGVGAAPLTELLPPGFSKSAFMNEVSSLLDHCGVYVSTMNGFCTSGCSLAKCLVRVFHAVPLYRETACTLLSNWEEIAQTTAAASASVKTETLMQLQDVLTRLETSADNREDELVESVHAVSSCLMAYIELQAQFSHSVFKALGKLSRQQQNGFLKTSRAEEAVRKQFSQIINRLTGPSAAKTASSSPPTSQASTPQQQTQSTSLSTLTSPSSLSTLTSPSSSSTLTLTSPSSSSTSTSTSTSSTSSTSSSSSSTSSTSVIWPAEVHPTCSDVVGAQPEAPSETNVSSGNVCPANDIADSGLDDVINLLSIGAASSLAACPAAGPAAGPAASSIPPKIPPRPNAFSQDAFRNKQLESSVGAKTSTTPASASASASASDDDNNSHKTGLPSWSPWGHDWSTEDLSKWPSHSSEASDCNPGWTRWQLSTAKDKTQTWPRPLRDPSTPWEWHDDEIENMLDSWKAGSREGERAAKTCTWPLKVAAESSWQEADPWRKDESLPTASKAPAPWQSDADHGFHLFDQQ